MAHIHHFRTLDQVQRLSLREVRSPQHTVANFAAFCGARQQPGRRWGCMKWSAAAANGGWS